MSGFIVIPLFILIVMWLIQRDSKQCHHHWMRYTIQKSIDAPRQKCVICQKCGKIYIKTKGLIDIDNHCKYIDIDALWREAESPITQLDLILWKNIANIDKEVNPDRMVRNNER